MLQTLRVDTIATLDHVSESLSCKGGMKAEWYEPPFVHARAARIDSQWVGGTNHVLEG